MKKYEEIVFLQGESAYEALEIYNERGFKSAIKFLTQWHYPGEHQTRCDVGNGTNDKLFRSGRYTMIVNNSLGYIGLVYEVSKNENQS